ncbi:MAG: dihydrodipicolinate synthase family protein [Chloroflexota bacterium]
MLKLTGIMPALLTPFDREGNVNPAMIRDLIEFQLAHGVSGFYVTGSTGEGLLLSEAERKLVVETAVDQVRGRAPVVAHVGAIGTRSARALAVQAQEAGADAISSIPPIYYHVGAEGIRQYYAQVAGASSLPFYVYNIPATTGVDVSVDIMRDLVAALPTLRGIKYTSHNFFEMRKLIELEGGCLNVVSGPDEMMIAGQAMGADGAIGTTYNILPRLFVQAYQAINAGDLARARELQAQGNRVIAVFQKFPALSAVKEMMRLIGFDCGAARSPNLPLTEAQRGQVREILQEIDFFAFADRG